MTVVPHATQLEGKSCENYRMHQTSARQGRAAGHCGKLDQGVGHRLRNERAGFLCAGRSVAVERETWRRGDRAFVRPRTREANDQGSPGERRGPRDSHCRRQFRAARSSGRFGEDSGGGDCEGERGPGANGLAERRSRIWADRGVASRSAGSAARHHHYAD